MKICTLLATLFIITLFSVSGKAQSNYNLQIQPLSTSSDTINYDDTLVYSFRVLNSNTCITSGLAYNHTLNFYSVINSNNGCTAADVYYTDSLLINPYRNIPLYIPLDSVSGIIDLKIPIRQLQLSGKNSLLLTLTGDPTVNLNTYECSDSGRQVDFFVKNPNCYANFEINPLINAGVYTGYNYSTGTNLTYLWKFGDGDTSSQQFPTHTYTSSGHKAITLEVYGSNTCTDVFCSWIDVVAKKEDVGVAQLIILSPTNVDEINYNQSVHVYPNPVSTELNVNLSVGIAEEITIYNLDGRLLHTVKFPSNNKIDVCNLNSGLYIAEVMIEKTIKRIRFVKL